MKKIIKFILCLLLLIPISTKATESYNLLGLGDSITTGYGISDSKNIYINILKDYLMEYYPNITLNNEAINGLTSKQMLNNIQNDKSLQDKIEYANMIVMSIGGNDYLQEIIYHQNPETFIKIGNQLLDNLESIYDSIFNLNKSVNLIVIPLYNPYLVLLKNNQELLKTYNKTQTDVINQINKYQVTYNKKIYTSDTLSRKIERGNNLNQGIDPHPNLSGHKLIAEECIKIYNEKIMVVDVLKEEKLVTNFFIKYKNYFIIIGFIILAYMLKKGYNKARR